MEQPQLIQMPAFADSRGLFVKTFHNTSLQEKGINFELKESYFSISHANVIRGMHYQLPPHEHSKIVFCPQGAILDVVVDLRKSSPDYGKAFSFELNDENNNALYIPIGFAHGFKSLKDNTITYYLVSSEYSQPHDTGIRYDSFGFDWGLMEPIISIRDAGFITIDDFNSVF